MTDPGVVSDEVVRAPSRRREQTRARLLDAAHELFAEVGMDAASVEAICERAGFTRGAFYSNFESKEELFLALIDRLTQAKMDVVEDRVRDLDLDDFSQPSALVRHVIGGSFGDGMDPHLIGEIQVQAMRDPRLASAYLAWQAGFVARIEAIVSGVAATGLVRLRLPAAAAARLLVDITDATHARAVIEGLSDTDTADVLHARLEEVIAALIDGSASAPPSP